MKSARGGEFGCWLQYSCRDHRQDEIATAVGMLIEEAVEMQLAQSAEDGGDVAVRAGADDVEGLRQRGAEGGGALQDGAQRIDFSRGPVGQIGDGAVVDLAVFAEALYMTKYHQIYASHCRKRDLHAISAGTSV